MAKGIMCNDAILCLRSTCTVWNALGSNFSHAMYETSNLGPETLSLIERFSFQHCDLKVYPSAMRKCLSLGVGVSLFRVLSQAITTWLATIGNVRITHIRTKYLPFIEILYL